MIFYIVKKEYDNYPRKDGSILVQNELYTQKEKDKYDISDKYLQKIDVKKNQTYWMFGARFANNIGYSGNPTK